MNFILGLARFLFGLYFFLYVLIHALLWLSPFTANFGIFMNLINWPIALRSLEQPGAYGLHNVHNFYLDTEASVRVGVWHYVPAPLEYEASRHAARSIKDHFEAYFGEPDGRPVILYAHGNDGDRARANRRGLCSRLASQLGYHVFAIDYRGYGDSSGWPSEQGVVQDVIALFNFIKAMQKKSEVYLWGHSLGTGISAHAAKVLSEFNSPPSGVILEAPFLNISKAAKEYILAPLILNNRWIIQKTDEALEAINLRLATHENIQKINAPVLILHAADDYFIPQDHSRELYKIAKATRPATFPPVKLIEYHEDLKLGHNQIYQHEELYPLIKDWIGK